MMETHLLLNYLKGLLITINGQFVAVVRGIVVLNFMLL